MAKKVASVQETGGTNLGKELQEKQIGKLDNAKKALESAVDGYIDSINKLNEELVELHYKIKEKEEELKAMDELATADKEKKVAELDVKIKGLEKEFNVKRNDLQVTFDLDVKANKEKVMADLMANAGLATISSQDLAITKSKLAKAEDNLAKGFQEELAKLETTLRKEYAAEVDILKLTHAKDQSSNEAEIKQMQAQITFLENQLNKAEQRVIDILDNQVKIAQADKGVTVNTYDKK